MVRSILAFIAVVLLASGLAAQERRESWNFDADNPGTIAKGFINNVGEWKIVADSTAPSLPNALAQLANSPESTFNITLVSDTHYKDLEVSVKMKALSGKGDQGGGLVWRAKDAKNYYVARYNPLENNYRVYKVEKGRRTQLKSAAIKRSEGWHTLMVTMKDDQIECYYDGTKYLDAKDFTFGSPGKIGLWTKADAQSHFDDLRVNGK